jgi:hypothetical protein
MMLVASLPLFTLEKNEYYIGLTIITRWKGKNARLPYIALQRFFL